MIIEREKHLDERGFLAELLSIKYGDFNCFHSYIATLNPGSSRANHYHKFKKEYITIAYGEVEVIIENVKTKEKKRVNLSIKDETHRILLINPYEAHKIKNNTSDIAVIIVFSNLPEIVGDTIQYEVEK